MLTVAGAAAELLGACLFAAMLGLTLREAVRARQPHAVLLATAGVGLLVQAALGLWWLADLAAEGQTLMPFRQNQVLLHLQFFGFLLPAILGVGMRSFPTFFGRKPPGAAAGGAVALLVLAGVAMWTGAGALADPFPGISWRWAVAGQGMTGAGILAAIVTFGPWRRARRLAPASRGLGWAIQPAALWLGVTGALLLGSAVQAWAGGGAVSSTTLDAIRHVFAVGVVTLAIIGMAQLILPEFASERLVRPPGGWRGPVFGGLLSIAAALRGVAPLAGLSGDARWWAMAAAGVIAWAGSLLFGVLLWRAARTHRAYLVRVSRFRRNEIPVTN